MKNSKSFRKLTKREFLILAVFLILAEIGIIYLYVIQPKYQACQETIQNVYELRKSEKLFREEYNKKQVYEDLMYYLSYRIEWYESFIPPFISQEHIINTLYKYAYDNNINMPMVSFGELSTMHIDEFISQTGKEIEEPGRPDMQVINQRVSVSLAGDYDSIYSFMNDLEFNRRLLNIASVNLSSGKDKKLKGTLELNIYSETDQMSITKFDMAVPYVQPKLNPFDAVDSGSVEFIQDDGSVIITPSQPQRVIPNFILLLNSYLYNGRKVTLSEYGLVDTALYYDANDKNKITFTLDSAENGEVKYTYSINGRSYSNTKKLDVVDNRIVFLQVMAPITDDGDKVSAEMTVTNNTGYILQIKGAKPYNPRLTIEYSGNVEFKD